jgi:hypothetical protein
MIGHLPKIVLAFEVEMLGTALGGKGALMPCGRTSRTDVDDAIETRTRVSR